MGMFDDMASMEQPVAPHGPKTAEDMNPKITPVPGMLKRLYDEAMQNQQRKSRTLPQAVEDSKADYQEHRDMHDQTEGMTDITDFDAHTDLDRP